MLSSYADSANLPLDSITPCSPFGGAANLKGFAHCRRPLPCDYRSHVGCRNLFCCRLVVFSLLKCVLARLFLDVNFQVTFLTHNYHFGHRYGRFWCQNLSFGRLGAPHWRLGGPWADPGAPGSRRKEALGSRLGFLLIFGDFGTPF